MAKDKFSTLWESPLKNAMGEPFLAVKAWSDKYYFVERGGVDSVAFLLYDPETDMVAAIKEFKPPIDEFMITAFGGSIDREYNELEDIVIDEVREEAGFVVTEDDIMSLGRVFVSTQSNQFCHLFMVMVDSTAQKAPQPVNELERMAEVVWVDPDSVLELEDWKSITIFARMSAVLSEMALEDEDLEDDE